jgi:chemotaxis-related protein WspD
VTVSSVRPDRCWRVIGTDGDRTCPELVQYIHCYNCPVYSQAGRQLLDGAPPAGYIEQWTTFLADARIRKGARTMSALVFRLGREWIGIDTAFVIEIADLRPSRRVAHRSDGALKGIVNIRGNLQLQVDLVRLLKIDAGEELDVALPAIPRLVVIKQAAATWVFRVDEVLGVQRFSSAELGPVPVTVIHRVARVSKGLLTIGDRKIGYLDTDVLFDQLRRAVG